MSYQTQEILELLHALPLFSGVDLTLLQKTIEGEHAHLLVLKAEELPPPAYSEMLGVVLAGKLQILSADAERSVVLRSITKGHIFGAASLFLENRAPVSRLLAQGDCSLLFLERDAVRELLLTAPAFMDAYLRFLAERVHFLNGKIRCFTAGSTERRLALWLAEQPEGAPFPVSSLTTLADTLDIGRASLYRALDKLEAEGLIARNGREMTVPSIESLLKKYHT